MDEGKAQPQNRFKSKSIINASCEFFDLWELMGIGIKVTPTPARQANCYLAYKSPERRRSPKGFRVSESLKSRKCNLRLLDKSKGRVNQYAERIPKSADTERLSKKNNLRISSPRHSKLPSMQMQVHLQKAPFPVLLVVSGVDAGGKGEVINILNAWLDPRGVETFAFQQPTDEEERACPQCGGFGVKSSPQRAAS